MRVWFITRHNVVCNRRRNTRVAQHVTYIYKNDHSKRAALHSLGWNYVYLQSTAESHANAADCSETYTNCTNFRHVLDICVQQLLRLSLSFNVCILRWFPFRHNAIDKWFPLWLIIDLSTATIPLEMLGVCTYIRTDSAVWCACARITHWCQAIECNNSKTRTYYKETHQHKRPPEEPYNLCLVPAVLPARNYMVSFIIGRRMYCVRMGGVESVRCGGARVCIK